MILTVMNAICAIAYIEKPEKFGISTGFEPVAVVAVAVAAA